MKERPIIFSGEMALAILDDRKTQTRRVVKPQPAYKELYCNEWRSDGEWWAGCLSGEPRTKRFRCPYGQPGDRLWVRETFALSISDPDEESMDAKGPMIWDHAIYKAGSTGEWKRDGLRFPPRWRPSIYMPRWASRITLKVTDVRVERVQDISERAARQEGVEPEYRERERIGRDAPSRLAGFERLWDSINAKRGYGWCSNPCVWVVEFAMEA